MEVGTGIFLGSLTIGALGLYVTTRDRWDWRRLVFRSILGMMGVGLVVYLGVVAYQTYQERLISTETFMNLRLSDTQADVRFKKGNPTETSGSTWGYAKDESSWDAIVIFRDAKVHVILYAGMCTTCHRLNGITIGSQYEEVINRLGPPTTVSSTRDNLSRYLSFGDTKMVVKMERGAVSAFGIYDPRIGPVEFQNQSRQELKRGTPAELAERRDWDKFSTIVRSDATSINGHAASDPDEGRPDAPQAPAGF